MYVIGVDPGSLKVGFAVLRNGNYLESAQISFPNNLPLTTRLAMFAGKARLYANVYPDAWWYLEDGFIGDNPRTSLAIGMARGVIVCVAGEVGARLALIPPKTVKQAVCGRGNATKKQVQKMVTAICKPDHVLGPDEADALATALAGWALEKEAELNVMAKSDTNSSRIRNNNEKATKRFQK